MRNLKRALSLALASVMLLGMMVVGTSAASYPDVDSNDNVEAIEVLNAVKVMIGDRGNFKPDAPVNRHEMAVIMAKLVLGNDTADNYVGTHPFTDVASWADKYVAACYENGIVAGTSKTTFGGDQPLTAVQAAAFMLRALGYKDLSKGEADWSVPVTATANQLRLFNGVASNPKAELDRNQVAQLALNTLKSPVVDLKDGTFTATDGDGKLIISGGSREYIVRSSLESYAYAINDVERSGNSASQISGATIELGEHLYNGKLRLNNSDMDVFGRPARTWEYDGKVVGTYVKEELLRKEYSVKVTGSDLYELLTQNTIDNYRFFISIDGETEESVLSSYGYFDTDDMYRSNKDGVGKTDKGVTTEVYVDATNKRVYISVINTYLAKAAEDYDEKNDDLDLTVYSIDEFSRDVYVKNKASDETMKVEGEDFAIKDVKEGDFFLVTVADGEIQTMKAPEILSEEIINAFKLTSWVKTSAAQYDYASTAKYDEEVLDDYDVSNMKNLTYNIILDKYGYLIGLERNEDPDQYVFLTGIDSSYSEITSRTAKANVIFMDGSMKTVTVNVKDSNLPSFGLAASQANTWCKYTVSSSGEYTLKQVAVSGATSAIDVPNKVKVAQYAQNVGGSAITIDQKHVSLKGANSAYMVYGNDATVYLNVDMDYLQTANSNYRYVIDDVESLNTGVKNVKITVSELGASVQDKNEKVTPKNNYLCPTAEIYTLYNDKGFILAAVTIGENEGVASNYAYIISSDVGREEYGHTSSKAPDGKWLWTREAVINGKITDLTEVGDTLQHIGPASDEGNMKRGQWYEVKYDADGNVRKSEEIVFTKAGDKYVNLVADVEKASETHDVVLMADTTTVERLSWSDNQVGTLWTDMSASKGFSVSPDVKLVLCLANKSGEVFKTNSDVYEGYAGVKRALSDMNASAPYAWTDAAHTVRDVEVSAILENGVATTIVINDKVPETNNKPSKPVDPNVYPNVTPDSINQYTVRYYDSNYGTTNQMSNQEVAALATQIMSQYFGVPVNRYLFGGLVSTYYGMHLDDGTLLGTQIQVRVIPVHAIFLDDAATPLTYVDHNSASETLAGLLPKSTSFFVGHKAPAASADATSNASGDLTAALAAVTADVRLYSAFKIDLTAPRATAQYRQANGTLAALTGGYYVEKGTELVLTGQVSNSPKGTFRRFVENAPGNAALTDWALVQTILDEAGSVDSTPAQTATYIVSKNVNIMESADYVRVYVDGIDKGYVQTAIPVTNGGSIYLVAPYDTTNSTAVRWCRTASLHTNNGSLLGSSNPSNVSGESYLYQPNPGHAVNGIIEITRAAEVTSVGAGLAVTYNGSAVVDCNGDHGSCTTAGTHHYLVAPGDRLTITYTDLAAGSKVQVSVNGGSAVDLFENATADAVTGSVTYTVPAEAASLTFSVGT